MCYKQLGDMDKATPYFYEIINNCDDNDLVVSSANKGLGMLVNEAREAASEYEKKGGKSDGKAADQDEKDDADDRKNDDEKDAGDTENTEEEQDDNARDADDEEE